MFVSAAAEGRGLSNVARNVLCFFTVDERAYHKQSERRSSGVRSDHSSSLKYDADYNFHQRSPSTVWVDVILDYSTIHSNTTSDMHPSNTVALQRVLPSGTKPA